MNKSAWDLGLPLTQWITLDELLSFCASQFLCWLKSWNDLPGALELFRWEVLVKCKTLFTAHIVNRRTLKARQCVLSTSPPSWCALLLLCLLTPFQQQPEMSFLQPFILTCVWQPLAVALWGLVVQFMMLSLCAIWNVNSCPTPASVPCHSISQSGGGIVDALQSLAQQVQIDRKM